MRLIASPRRGATERTVSFLDILSSGSGMVFVTITSSRTDPSIRSSAGPEKTGCVQLAKIRFAPFSRSAGTACVRVPPVSIMSSTIITSRPSTSPTMCITFASLGAVRRLSINARGRQQVSHQLRGDGHARLHLSILPPIAIVRHDGCDPPSRRSLQGVDDHQQFHQVLVDGPARRLNHEDIGAPDILENLDQDLVVGKP